MKAAVLYQGGAPDVLQYEEVPDATCSPETVLIRTMGISIEGGDLLARGRTPSTTPHIIGYCAAGEAIEVGSRVTGIRVGDRVATFDFAGSHAELRAVPASYCWPMPSDLDPAIAAAVPVTFGTAHDCLFEEGRLRAGQTVLIQGASGGVGLAGVQLAKLAGATVIAAGSSDRRLSELKSYGADHVINHTAIDLAEAVLAVTNGRGVDLAIDPIGGTLLQESLACVGQRGRLVSFGQAAQEPMVLDVSNLRRMQQTVIGLFFGADMATDRVRQLIMRLLNDVSSGTIRSVVDRIFPLSEAAEAHAYATSPDRGLGRVVLKP